MDKFESLAAEAVQWVGADTSEAEEPCLLVKGLERPTRSCLESRLLCKEEGAEKVFPSGVVVSLYTLNADSLLNDSKTRMLREIHDVLLEAWSS